MTPQPTNLPILEIGKQLNEKVFSVLGQTALIGFEKAYMIAEATKQLKLLLTPEYMAPIMELQGSRLGFKTDNDKSGGYGAEVVKNCLIEAVLMGVQPVGNQFNIIAGNTYITKEGYGELLSKIAGLKYYITFELPRMNDKSAAVVAVVKWQINGGAWQIEKPELPIKVNSGMGADGVLGKGERKARKWLYQTITGTEVTDGDVEDTEAVVMKSTPTQADEVDKGLERIILMLKDCKTLEAVQELCLLNPELDSKLVDERIAQIELETKSKN